MNSSGLKIMSLKKRRKLNTFLLKQRYKIESECNKKYEIERKLRDRSYEEDLENKLEEQKYDFERKIKNLSDVHNELIHKISNELISIKEENKKMRKEYKRYKLIADNLDLIMRRLNNRFKGIGNKINLTLAQFTNEFSIIGDEAEREFKKLEKGKLIQLEGNIE